MSSAIRRGTARRAPMLFVSPNPEGTARRAPTPVQLSGQVSDHVANSVIKALVHVKPRSLKPNCLQMG